MTLKARFASKPKYHVLPKPRARTGSIRSESEDVYTSIDPILDKISKFGIGCLTASERAVGIGGARTIAEKFGVISSRRPLAVPKLLRRRGGRCAWAIQSHASHSEAATATPLSFIEA